MIYKISYVVIGKPHPGEIANTETPPHIGDKVTLGNETFEVIEIVDLIPPHGDFAYLHVTCKPLITPQ